ncbi:hypothetical protein B0A55_08774 [Friedmanniomyces simplex]|uniref:Endonuclease/exonuclease/phosphatase domain-containing protein n=1 Tax=Friedmanniomyces simplex TaxID=329884 RepID=A0A4U0WYG8_9PEZI|nr:hypothetical protein B0A55_08774 [Friedmanniomyces simplex]
MDELVKQSIAIVEQRKKAAVPWVPDEPHNQPYYRWLDGEWQATKPGVDSGGAAGEPKPAPGRLALYSWNIDFMLPYGDPRMLAAIRHLEQLGSAQASDIPIIIFFNECLESDLKVITSDAYVRERFHVTDLSRQYWQSGHYGTTTLVDKRLAIQACFRIHYSKTRMERDGLFVDLKLGTTQPQKQKQKPLRLCNTHLESLALDPPFRPPQLALCARHMHSPDVHASILAGDLNAIQDFDKHLHSDNELMDAYLELGGSEDEAEAGHTWGQQAATAQRERFGTCRMDKVLFCGKVTCQSFERFGVDVQIQDEREREEIVRLGFDKPWITDHLGVKAIFSVDAE